MRTSKKAIQISEVKLDVPKVKRKNPTIIVLISFNSHFSSLVVVWSTFSMTTMLVSVRDCIWVLGSYKLEALGALIGFLDFSLCIVANYCALVLLVY